jgi:hypothetical protein
MADLGHDLSCVSDLDPSMREVQGRIALAQACARRLQTPRGRLIDDPDYGYDLTDEIGDDLSPSDIARIASSVDAEMLKDERVLASSTVVTFLNQILIVTVSLTDGAGPFLLVLQVSAVSVQLLTPVQQ